MLDIRLPTTSAVQFTEYFSPSTAEAESHINSLQDTRSRLRSSLKTYKRASSTNKSTSLQEILNLVETYHASLLQLQDFLSSSAVREISPLTTHWTPLAHLLPSHLPTSHQRKPPTVSLPSEITQATFLLALLYYQLGTFTGSPSSPHLKKCTQHLQLSSSIFMSLPADHLFGKSLAALTWAEATLLSILPMDPYPSYLALTSTSLKYGDEEQGKEWLYTPPERPRSVKALLIARLCIAASEHGSRAASYIHDEKAYAALKRYCDGVHREAKARAIRFLAVDAESSGRVGEGIGWVRLGRKVLKGWECDEEKTLKELEERWERSNERYGFEAVVGEEELRGRLPSGREVFNVTPWKGGTHEKEAKGSSTAGYY